jgi:hypothetical protein
MLAPSGPVHQCRPPRGWLGRWFPRNLNKYDSALTDRGVSLPAILPAGAPLDIGGGGRTMVQKLAAAAPHGKTRGIDHSEASQRPRLARLNAPAVAPDQVEIRADR